MLFFCTWWYGGETSGGVRRLILGPRFLIPLTPLVALALSDVAPRLWRRLLAALSPHGALRAWRVAQAGALVCAVGVAVGAFGVHAGMHRVERAQAPLLRALADHTAPPYDDAEGVGHVVRYVVITNIWGTSKLFASIPDDRPTVSHRTLPPAEAAELARTVPVRVAFLYRDDSELWRNEAAEYDAYIGALQQHARLDPLLDREFGALGRLRVWRVTIGNE